MDLQERLGTTRWGRWELAWGKRTYVMGIINATPDSFSGDGLEHNVESAVEQGLRFQAEGADIVDVGGESTRPGSTAVDAEEEMRRILPVIRGLASSLDIPISVDTYKSEVARAAIDAGASIINDVWGLKHDPDMAALAAKEGVPVVLMHNQNGTDYADLVPDVMSGLRSSLSLALEAGVPIENVILDPGMGFGKTAEHNLEILRRLAEFKDLGRPLLVGMSRKRTIGYVLDAPVDDRVEGTAATVALSVANGADIVRVHDVKVMARVARMSDAVVRGWERPPDICMSEVTAYLGLGSNLGDRETHLRKALSLLGDAGEIIALSSVYETEPWGYAEQPSFLNMVCGFRTSLSPPELLALAQEVERRLGRVRTIRYGPRTMDVDILLYGDLVLDTPDLQIPHPRIPERAFVLAPLVEIASDMEHPTLKRPIRALLADAPGRETVVKLGALSPGEIP